MWACLYCMCLGAKLVGYCAIGMTGHANFKRMKSANTYGIKIFTVCSVKKSVLMSEVQQRRALFFNTLARLISLNI